MATRTRVDTQCIRAVESPAYWSNLMEVVSADNFLFLRPFWFVAIVPLAIVLWKVWSRVNIASDWDQIVDASLASHVLEPAGKGISRWPLWLIGTLWFLVVLILAGPSWSKLETPVYSGEETDVLVLDLSRSMDADDLRPSRLARAKYKISDFLAFAAGRQIGLVVFSEAPYVVSPLTDDVATLEAFLPALDTSVVPVQGSQIAVAIERARQLLQQADATAGSIVLLTDSRSDGRANAAAQQVVESGYTLSVIGIGTRQGVPLRSSDGGFIKDATGKIVVPGLERESLIELASAGHGMYTDIQTDNSDIDLLSANLEASGKFDPQGEDRKSFNWIEYAPWLLPFVLLIMLSVYRRGSFQ